MYTRIHTKTFCISFNSAHSIDDIKNFKFSHMTAARSLPPPAITLHFNSSFISRPPFTYVLFLLFSSAKCSTDVKPTGLDRWTVVHYSISKSTILSRKEERSTPEYRMESSSFREIREM